MLCGYCILEAGFSVGLGKQRVLWRSRMCAHEIVVSGAWGLILRLASRASKLNLHTPKDLLLSIRVS